MLNKIPNLIIGLSLIGIALWMGMSSVNAIPNFYFFSLIFSSLLLLSLLYLIHINNELRSKLNNRVQQNQKITFSERNLKLFDLSETIAHDLKEPIRTIRTYSFLLKQENPTLDKQSLEYLDILNSSSKQVENFVQSFLDFSSTLSTDDLSPRQTNNLKDAYTIANKNLEGLIKENQAELIPHFKGSTELEFNMSDMVRIIQNLLSNSIKHCPKSRTAVIDFIVEEKQNGVLIKVIDNGVGLKTVHLGQITEPFYKANYTNRAPGTGLGLSIVQNLTTKYDGLLSYQNNKDRGATFEIFIPNSPKILLQKNTVFEKKHC